MTEPEDNFPTEAPAEPVTARSHRTPEQSVFAEIVREELRDLLVEMLQPLVDVQLELNQRVTELERAAE